MQFFPGSTASETWFPEGCYITEWANDPADPEISVARARVPVGGTTRWHALTGINERYVILAGEGLAEVGTAAPQPMRPGDVILIEPDEPQRITNAGQVDLVFLAFCTPRFVPQAYREVAPPARKG